MARSLPTGIVGVVAVLAAGAVQAEAQAVGTFSWQLQPYCNVVTVTITRQGGVYALDGVDDQCGAGKLAATDGTAFLNPDGTIGLGFTIVPSPDGIPVTVDASIDPGSLGGPWRDTAGNRGTLVFGPASSPGGSPRPGGQALAGVFVGSGLRFVSTSGKLPPHLEIDDLAIRKLVEVVQSGSNIGLGRNAMPHPGGVMSTAVGENAMNGLTTGRNNTAVGANALKSMADGSENVAVGSYALTDNSSNKANVAVGSSALAHVVVGDANVGLGDQALLQLSLGRNNIAIGQQAGFGLVGGNYNIYIGTTSPSSLDNYTTRLGSPNQQRAFIGGIRGVQTGIGNAVPVVVDSNGQLGTINSSRRFKEDIQDLGAAGDKVLDLRPVQFRYKTPFSDGSAPVQYGLIAEEVEEVLPELVSRSADGQIETVQYHVLPTLLLKQVQRLERERAAMAERLAALEAELGAMRASTPSVSVVDPRQR